MAKSRAAPEADKSLKGTRNQRAVEKNTHAAKVTKDAKSVRNQSNSSGNSDSEENGVQSDNENSDTSSQSDASQSDSEDTSSSDSDNSLKLKINGKEEVTKSLKKVSGISHSNGTHSASDNDSDDDSTSESENSQSEQSDSDHEAHSQVKKAANGKAGHEDQKPNGSRNKSKSKIGSMVSKPEALRSKNDDVTDTSQSSSDDAGISDDSSNSTGSSQDISDDTPDEMLERKAAQVESLAARKRKADAVDVPTAKKSKTDASASSANLFVGNLSWNVDEEWLQREFAEFGDIAGCRVIRDRDSGRSKGFGYVEFSDASNAAEALGAKKGALLDGREMNVDFSVPRSDNSNTFNRVERVNDRASKFGDAKSNPSDTLFIGNIAFSATAEELQETFGEYGHVTRVSLPTDQENGAPKGFGYVSFASVEEAKGALEALNGENIGGRAIRLDYATPRTNGDRGIRGGRGDFRGGRGGDRGGRGGWSAARGGRGENRGRGNKSFSTNRGGFGDFSGRKVTF